MEKLINNAPFALVLVFLVIGFVLLIKGADFFVEGSSSVAKRLHVPSIIIGLTIVAMGTSLPETAVSVSASLAGNNELAVSNVVGSNIFNLMVVIGVCAMIATVEVARETIRRDIPLSLICAWQRHCSDHHRAAHPLVRMERHVPGIRLHRPRLCIFLCFLCQTDKAGRRSQSRQERKQDKVLPAPDEVLYHLETCPLRILRILYQ